MQASRSRHAMPVQAPGLLVGDVVAEDCRGMGWFGAVEPFEEGGPLVSWYIVQVVQDGVEETVRRRIIRKPSA